MELTLYCQILMKMELNDGLEITIGINPLASDSDSDGLNDTWEYNRISQGYNYNPGNNDTDGRWN